MARFRAVAAVLVEYTDAVFPTAGGALRCPHGWLRTGLGSEPTLPVWQSRTTRSAYRSLSRGDSMKLLSIDPTNGELIESFDEISE